VARLHHECAVAADLARKGFVRPVGVVRFDRRVGLVLEDVGGLPQSSSLPATSLQMLTGRLPFQAVDTLELIHRHFSVDETLAPRVV
jgi:hypothetical protein